ncbi:hypothetical protein BC940DRAFT_331707 [Gongronella butleri]|nr:hypothetical protein BC940DRAFT_331707 [Gongronella butleri]
MSYEAQRKMYLRVINACETVTKAPSRNAGCCTRAYKWRKYIVDRPFALRTDNTALTYLYRKVDTIQRLQRWIVCLQEFEFDFEAVHLLGKLQELYAMECARGNNPLDFIEEFGTVLRAAGVQDSQAFGSMLLDKLDISFERLTTQIRNIQAIPPREEREPLTVEYIRDRAPRVYSAKWDGSTINAIPNKTLICPLKRIIL